MKNWILALGALSVVSGCSPIVLEPLKGTQSAETPVVPGPTPTDGHTILAIRGGDVLWNEKDDFGLAHDVFWSDPDSLVLFFSSDFQQCNDPVLARRCLGAAPFWQAIVAIPPELARPGLIDLQDPRIRGYTSLSAMDGTPACGGGGGLGPLSTGTLEILESGPAGLALKLSGGAPGFGNVMLDGEYTAQICGTLAAALPPTPALAIRGSDLPAGSGGSSSGGGAPPDPDSLLVVLGTLPDTCSDPLAAADCTTASRLTFTLPPALQKPGIIDLSDPSIAATYTVAASSASSSCGPPSGPLVEGTVEILTSDASGLTFKVYRSFSSWSQSVPFYFDGLYAASICP
jgi:hypothetical protein